MNTLSALPRGWPGPKFSRAPFLRLRFVCGWLGGVKWLWLACRRLLVEKSIMARLCSSAGELREFWAWNWSTCVCQTEQRKGGPTIAWKIGLLAWLEGWKVGRLVGWLVIPLNMRLQIASLQTDSRVADHFGVTYWPIAR